ncbi:MAG: hypothetical protein ACPGWR_23120 [Ardenticatenaceae bacterium]
MSWNIIKALQLWLLLLLFVTSCTPEEVADGEVPVTQIVEVTREVPIEVTREVPIEVPIEVTREVPIEVPIEVTREVQVIVEVTREVPTVPEVEGVEVTAEVPLQTTEAAVEVASEEQPPQRQPEATSAPPVAATVISIPGTENQESSDSTANPPPLATTIAIAGQEGHGNTTCWTWQEAAQHLGENGCVEASVTGVGNGQTAFFINFSPDRNSFYAVSFDWIWEELTSECLRVSGQITEYQSRPQIIINDPATQLQYCGGNDAPPAFAR